MIPLPVRGLFSIYLFETFCQGGFYPFSCVYGSVQELLEYIYHESIHVIRLHILLVVLCGVGCGVWLGTLGKNLM